MISEDWYPIILISVGIIIGFLWAGFICLIDDIRKFIELRRKEKCK